jgi:hypothetical protein
MRRRAGAVLVRDAGCACDATSAAPTATEPATAARPRRRCLAVMVFGTGARFDGVAVRLVVFGVDRLALTDDRDHDEPVRAN